MIIGINMFLSRFSRSILRILDVNDKDAFQDYLLIFIGIPYTHFYSFCGKQILGYGKSLFCSNEVHIT